MAVTLGESHNILNAFCPKFHKAGSKLQVFLPDCWHLRLNTPRCPQFLYMSTALLTPLIFLEARIVRKNTGAVCGAPTTYQGPAFLVSFESLSNYVEQFPQGHTPKVTISEAQPKPFFTPSLISLSD